MSDNAEFVEWAPQVNEGDAQSSPIDAAPSCVVDDEVCRRAYQVLVGEFGFGNLIAMGSIGNALLSAGIDKRDYGYEKLLNFLERFSEFLVLEDIVGLKGQANKYGTVHKVERYGEVISALPASVPPAPAVSVSPTAAPADGSPASSSSSSASSHAARRESPGNELFSFAYLGPYDKFLDDLAEMALPEPWGFKEGDRSILDSYVRMTFLRLGAEGKVRISGDGSFAAFNTGLVNQHYDDIYACFVPNARYDRQPWFFKGFCVAGERRNGGLGKRLVSTFSPLPESASYFDSIDDLFFDTRRGLEVDYDHIIVDNIGRMPVTYLEDALRGDEAAMDLLDLARRSDRSGAQEAFCALGQYVGDSRLYRSLRNDFEGAERVAVKRARWNYKAAIPCYYPRHDKMALLLPICLVDDARADLALLVELTDSGSYQGQTILTMQMAYKDARLIYRPDSDWLSAC